MGNKSLVYGRVYPYTNENLVEYNNLFEFKDKNVLSVLGSGDQYFSFLLFGAKSVTLFDINNVSNYYFTLKYYSILILSYEEFIEFFVFSKLDNMTLYNKVRSVLPAEPRYFFDTVIKNGRKLSSLIYSVSLNSNPINFSSGRVVPYFDKDEYLLLQSILKEKKYPYIYNVSIEYLYEELNDKFDIMFFSNIFLHLSMNVKRYKELIDKYLKLLNENGIIQANYSWINEEDLQREFIKYGFDVKTISSIRYVNEDTRFEDYVYTLKKS